MRAFILRCRALGRDISLEFLDGLLTYLVGPLATSSSMGRNMNMGIVLCGGITRAAPIR